MAGRKKVPSQQQAAATAGMPFGMTLVVVWTLVMVSLSGHMVSAEGENDGNSNSAVTTAAGTNDTTPETCQADSCTNGQCNDTGGTVRCECSEGWTGDRCDEDVDECEEEMCLNDEYCENWDGTFKCECKDGWNGTYCTEDIDECNSAELHKCPENSQCLNNNGSSTCPCMEGYERLPGAIACTAQVLLPYNTSFSTVQYGDDEIFGPFSIPGGFRLDGQNDVTAYYISIDGYITFNSKFSNPKKPPAESGLTSTLLFVAPYWADIDIPSDQGVTSGLYHVALTLNDTYQDNETKALFDEYKKELEFEPLFIAVVTWVNVLPYKAEDYANFKGATFQAALFTDGVQTTTRLAWRTVWPKREQLKVEAAMRFSDTNKKNLSFTGAPLKTTETITLDPDPKSTTAECVKWLANEGRQLPASGAAGMACPCSLQQARDDPVFVADDTNFRATSKVYDPAGLKQVCVYSATTELLDTNLLTAGIPLLRSTVLNPNVTDGRDKCCSQTTATSSTCAAFRELFPVETCARRPLPVIAALWGSLHVAAMRGDDTYAKYIFNGWGEYTVLKNYEGNLIIQIRTDKVPDLNVTVIKAVAMKYNGNVSEIHLADKKLKMYGDGIELTDPAMVPASLGIYVKYLVLDKELEVVLPNGFAATVTAETDRLSLVLMGDAETTLVPTITPLEDEAASLFRYNVTGDGDNFTSYQHPDFVATQTPTLDELKAEHASNATCNVTDFDAGGQQCIEDMLLTNQVARANESRDIVKKMLDYVQVLGEKPPMFVMLPPVWSLTTATSASFTQDFNVTGPNVTVTASGASDLNHTLEKLEGNIWRFSWVIEENKLRELTTWSLSFEAKSSLTNMASSYSPDVVVCACAAADQCDNAVPQKTISEITWPHKGKLYLSNCQCGPGKKGRFCQEEVDICFSCYNNDTCEGNATDIASACTSCPPGYIGNGVKCYEIDECLKGNVCDQLCTNTVGSYTCSCNDGYVLRGNRTCEDIDECLSDPCGSTQFCLNRQPGHLCFCHPGYFESENGCTKAAAIYGGFISFLSMSGQEWSPDLKNPMSTQFNHLAEKVKTLILKQLESKNIPVISVDVLEFELESNNRKRRSVGSSQNQMIKARYQIGTSKKENATVVMEAVKSGFNAGCTSDLCRYGTGDEYLKGVSRSQSGVDVNYDLCTNDRSNNCHGSSTDCVIEDGLAVCRCRHGYERWPLYDNVCQDVDECQDSTYTTQELCGLTEAEGASCNNTVGSYYCICPQTHRWDSAAMKCSLNLCETDNPCQNGATCVSTEDQTGVACRCTDGWAGLHCDDEDAEAKKMKTALIVVGSVLGGLCLILLIALVIVCFVKRRRKGQDLDSRYEVRSGGSIPRARVGPPHGHSGASADQHREMQRQDSMHKYTDFRRNNQDVGARNGASGKGSQLYNNPAFSRDGERL